MPRPCRQAKTEQQASPVPARGPVGSKWFVALENSKSVRCEEDSTNFVNEARTRPLPLNPNWKTGGGGIPEVGGVALPISRTRRRAYTSTTAFALRATADSLREETGRRAGSLIYEGETDGFETSRS
jgi:hypothetical protein